MALVIPCLLSWWSQVRILPGSPFPRYDQIVHDLDPARLGPPVAWDPGAAAAQ